MAKSKTSSYAQGFTLIEIMIVVLIIGILLSIAVPGFIHAEEDSRANACIANLSEIDKAKAQYVMDFNANSFTPAVCPGDDTLGGLIPTYIRTVPTCPEQGIYNTGTIDTLPTCSIGTSAAIPHVLTE